MASTEWKELRYYDLDVVVHKTVAIHGEVPREGSADTRTYWTKAHCFTATKQARFDVDRVCRACMLERMHDIIMEISGEM